MNLQTQSIANAFSKASSTYDQSAVIQREIGARLLDLLELTAESKPKNILDLGSGTGFFANQLSNKFPQANIIQLDISEKMLQVAQNKYPNVTSHCCADILNLPFKPQSFDLIFSNCTLQWIQDTNRLFNILHSLLIPQGILLFSSFGPDTLLELKQSFSNVDNYPHVIEFTDMHILGDQLLAAKFQQPLLQRENLVLTYDSVEKILQDLKNTGAVNQHVNKCKYIFTPAKYKQLLEAYQNYVRSDNLYPATFEAVYGMAYGANFAARQFQGSDNQTFIPIESLLE